MSTTNSEEKSTWGGSREGAGRSPVKASVRRRKLVVVRFTDGENATVKKAARKSRRDLSGWMREVLLASA
jgi:hypothetical protein